MPPYGPGRIAWPERKRPPMEPYAAASVREDAVEAFLTIIPRRYIDESGELG